MLCAENGGEMRCGRNWALGARYGPSDQEIASPFSDPDGYIGAKWLDDLQQRTGATRRDVPGLVDSLDELRSDLLDPDLVAPGVRALYERTSDLSFLATRLDFGVGGWMVQRALEQFTRRVDQLHVPTDSTYLPRWMSSRTSELSFPDGTVVRGWERTFARSSDVFYVSVVRVVRQEGRPYLAVTIPFGGYNVAIVFEMSNALGGGVRLRSTARWRDAADITVVVPGRERYAQMPGFGLGDEVLVRPARTPDGAPYVSAVHRSTLFGFRSFELHYEVFPLRRDG